MSNPRITYLGQQVYPRKRLVRNAKGQFSITSWLKHAVRWVAIRMGIGLIAFGVLAGAYFIGVANAREITATNVISVTPPVKTGIPPILHKIAVAESSDMQYGKDGQVVIHVNPDFSYDIGRYQINSRWNATATKMGYNLMNEKDNEAFAEYLFSNYGSEPWSSSKSRWLK